MRDSVYVHGLIASDDTKRAVETLANALHDSGVCDYALAAERICRLIGWMCERAEER